MALAHALLALLATDSFSGYDLAREFEGTVGSFWKATHQQIYRELAQLEQKGAVQPEAILQEGRPNKKLYHLTPTGRQLLADWIATSDSEPCPVREALLVKVFVGHLVPPALLLVELRRHRQLHQQRLEYYREMERSHFADPAHLPLEDRYAYLPLRRGLTYEQGWVEWCDEAIACIETIDQERPAPTGSSD